MGTPQCFPAIFAKGDNFCDFLFASLDSEAYQNGLYSQRKEFAPREQILSFESEPPMKSEPKMKIT